MNQTFIRKASTGISFSPSNLNFFQLIQPWMEVTGGTRSDESPFNAHALRHRYCSWKVKRRRKIAARDRDHHIPLAFISSEAREHKLKSSPPLVQFMKYVVPAVLALVTLKYQAKTESLFWENRAPLWCFVAATCVYWLIVGAMKQITTLQSKCFQISSRAAFISGILSALSLVSMFLPYPWSLVPIISWTPLPVVLAWPILYHAYNLLHRVTTYVINKIHALVDWARGFNLTEEASLSV